MLGVKEGGRSEDRMRMGRLIWVVVGRERCGNAEGGTEA